jgi:hypothetical protein
VAIYESSAILGVIEGREGVRGHIRVAIVVISQRGGGHKLIRGTY